MLFDPLERPDRYKFEISKIHGYRHQVNINLVTFQYSLNIFKQYMYITTSTNRVYGILLLCAQFTHGLVNSAMGQIPCSTKRISSFNYSL